MVKKNATEYFMSNTLTVSMRRVRELDGECNVTNGRSKSWNVGDAQNAECRMHNAYGTKCQASTVFGIASRGTPQYASAIHNKWR